jgi:3-oxoacyl-[acyl-carrier-protein] synthase-1
MTGHTLGAAGACEAAFLWLSLHPDYNRHGYLPPHLWDGAADPAIGTLNLAAPGARMENSNGRAAMLSNSFAFGGNNVALVLGSGVLGQGKGL